MTYDITRVGHTNKPQGASEQATAGHGNTTKGTVNVFCKLYRRSKKGFLVT